MISAAKIKEAVELVSKKHNIGLCDWCKMNPAQYRPSMTAYHWDNKEDLDPNRDVFLCGLCYEEYSNYWTEMWAEYNNSIRC